MKAEAKAKAEERNSQIEIETYFNQFSPAKVSPIHTGSHPINMP